MATSRELFSRLEEIRELADGYEFRLADDSSVITIAAEFISIEKLCCPFLNFGLEIKAEGGPVWFLCCLCSGNKCICLSSSRLRGRSRSAHNAPDLRRYTRVW